MKGLQAPVKDALRTTTTPASVARMWARIEARGRGKTRAAVPRRPWLLVAAVVAAASAAFGGGAVAWRATVHASPAARVASTPNATPASKPEPEPQSVPAPVSASVSASAPASVPAPTPHATWRDLAAHGDNAQAYATLGSAGLASAAKSASVEDLFALADVARLSGHPADARLPLERIVAEHARDGRASLAALTLGRIDLRSSADPNAAADAVAKAIDLGLPRGIADEAYPLLVEARGTAGDRAGARAAFAEYEARFPEEAKARADGLRRWIDGR